MNAAKRSMYTMSVDLSVLESLGINLYSNAAAVLSELVANAYDADASFVRIDWKQQGETVVVTDDGSGMTVPQINERFLTVGYKKRSVEGDKSVRFQRPFMGRKGIGKLSVFSIAQVVEVFTTTDSGHSNGLRIKVEELEQAIAEQRKYHPIEVPVPKEYKSRGTTLVLSALKSKRASLTASALRKRLARRFDVLDSKKPEQGGFRIEVNGKQLTWADRQELKKLEFIWEFGEQALPKVALPSGVTRFTLDSAVDATEGWLLRGWFGTAKRPTDLTDDEEAGSLKNIIVLARKRPIQEGIVDKLDFSRIFGNYVTGQIEADFLDLANGDYEDIATSDRQRLIEDDDRVVALRNFLRQAFIKAADQWSEQRPKKEAVDVLYKYPQLQEWVSTREPDQRDVAERMLGTIASLELEKKTEDSRRDLFRAGVLAFERIGLRRITKQLEELGDVRAEQLLPLLGSQDAYESGLWLDILKSRVDAISQMRNLADDNEKERVLQTHLFGHLWLLDPAWERATTDARMEEDLRRVAPGLFAKDQAGEEIKGRMDIRYATASGRHIIVELKRYSVALDIDDLFEQGAKYFRALNDLLNQQQAERPDDIEVMFVLGTTPSAKGRVTGTDEEYRRARLENIHGRYILYDALIRNAQHQYEQYLNASDEARKLEDLLGTLEHEEEAE